MLHIPRTVAILGCVLMCLAQPTLADSLPDGFSNHKFNDGNDPVTKGGVTTFTLKNRQCSDIDYGDGRGENDCRNGMVRSTVLGRPTARLGQSFEYRFELRVVPPLSYAGFQNPEHLGHLSTGRDSRLRLATWEGNKLHNWLYQMKLEARRGVTFMDRVCFDRYAMTNWNSFVFQVGWESDKTGWSKAFCNDRLIWSQERVATSQPSQCYVANLCEPGVRKNPTEFIFILGPLMSGVGADWARYGFKSQFTDFESPITVQFRNMAIRRVKR